MNNYHQEIITSFEQSTKTNKKYNDPQKYSGNSDFSYHISVPVVRSIAREFIQSHSDLTYKELIDLIYSLAKSRSHEEKTIIGKLLEYAPVLRKNILPYELEPVLNSLFGWEQIDSLCQSTFTDKEVLENWSTWESFIVALSLDENINKRRASMVFLTGVVSQNDDSRASTLAFQIIRTLMHEKPILITKAISWLLRSLVKHHKQQVKDFIAVYKDELPKIAARETLRKIETGKK